MSFIEFTFENGRKVMLNVTEIKSITPTDKGCYITYKMKDGYSEGYTINDYKNVREKLEILSLGNIEQIKDVFGL